MLRTERGRISAYRLAVERDSVDLFEFQDFIAQARRANPAMKVDMLRRAIALWSGVPLADAADRPWAAQPARQLTALRHTARLELAHAYDRVGRPEDALEAGEQLSWDMPDDTELTAFLSTLRRQLRGGQHKQVFRHDFTDPGIAIVLMPGDLFAQDDANLVVGFTDTFDTESDRNLVISSESVQGQLTQRLYGGDRRRLDRELKTALQRVTPESVETPAEKPRGKRIRYPLGTVATLHHAKRRVFAVAYSRMGNNLVAHSSLPLLRMSLENLWTAVYLHGQLKPVAIPLIGSGLARVHEASFEDLLIMIISSFADKSRTRYICPELRIIIQQPALKKIRTEEILKFIREFDPGVPPAGGDGN